MRSVPLFVAVASCALVACGSDEGTPAPEPGPCADTTLVPAMPTPLWESTEGFAPPDGDYALGLVAESRPTWAEELVDARGWPRRPTFVLPLGRPASSVNVDRLELWMRSTPDEALVRSDAVFAAELDETGTSLVARARDPLPPGDGHYVLVVRSGAAGDAVALPACDAAGAPHRAYAVASAGISDTAGLELALPFVVADTSTELPRLWSRVTGAPVLEVDSVIPRTLASFGDAAPSEEVASLIGPTVAECILSLPDYRGENGRMHPAEDGAPEPMGTTHPGVLVVVPTQGQRPFPFVLFQHGGSQNKTDVLALAGPIAREGFALVAFDLPEHGNRPGPTGGTDGDIFDFTSPLRTRDTLRQGAADHLALVSGLGALNDAIEPVFGDGPTLDPSRAYLMSLSIGSLVGTMTFASAPEIEAAALFVAGGGYPELLNSGIFSVFVANILSRPSPEREAILGFAEVLLDGADPLAYAAAENRSVAPRPVVFMQAVDDPVIPMPSSDQWGRAFGAALALPAHHEVAGMQQVALPAAENFRWSAGGPPTTRLLVQNPMPGVPVGQRHAGLIVESYSQELVAHCFSTLRSSGSCEVIDTGFAR